MPNQSDSAARGRDVPGMWGLNTRTTHPNCVTTVHPGPQVDPVATSNPSAKESRFVRTR